MVTQENVGYLFIFLFLMMGSFSTLTYAQRGALALKGWRTDTSIRSIDLDELLSGGPPKDGIPSIDHPRFISVSEANSWLKGQEPVILVAVGSDARAYPLQILTWHEIVNDELAGQPIVVTFCPLCYAALAFDRRINGEVHSFGVSGMLRHSDMVMYDRTTETLWQQLNGEGIVGTYTGKILTPVPAQIVSYDQFREAHPFGEVLSRDTGYLRNYGKNPYVGYDDVNDRPYLYRGPFDKRVPPMEKLVTVSMNGFERVYPHSVTRKKRVIHDTLGDIDIVVFHTGGAVSALDKSEISDSKVIGSTGVFVRQVDGLDLTFTFDDGKFVDSETETKWDITGKAISGSLKGKQLTPLPHGNFFAFAWFAFKPNTDVYQ